MFRTASLTDITLLKKTWSEWNMMNWVRSLVILAGLFFSFFALQKTFSVPGKVVTTSAKGTTYSGKQLSLGS